MSEKRNMSGIQKRNQEQNRILKQSLKEALIILMEEKNFDEISISELCRKAGVSRTGFYSNFSAKNDVFEEIAEDFISEINEKISPLQKNNSLKWYEDFFYLVKKNSEIYKKIQNAGFQGRYLDISNSIILNHDWIDEDEKYRRLLFNGAIQNAAFEWIRGGMKISSEKMAEKCFDFIEK